MKIELVKTTPDRAGRYFVKLEDGSALRLYRQTLEDYTLYTGRELSDREWEQLQVDAGRMSAKMRAVRILSATSVSKRDLQHRLVQKGEDPEQAKEAVQWMENLDLLDDQKVARQVVARCISKGYGPARARQALYEKQIPKEYWDEALEDYPDMEEKILDFLRSRLDGNSDAKEVRRAVDALMRRGHSYGQIRKAMNQLTLDAEEFPED